MTASNPDTPQAQVHHVVIVSLGERPTEKAKDYAEFLVSKGVIVDMIVVDEAAASTLALAAPGRVHTVVSRAQRRAGSGGSPRRLVRRLAAVVRPWSLARRARPALRGIDLSTVERIVAADTDAVTLAWKLSRRVPEAVATTTLDRDPYADLR